MGFEPMNTGFADQRVSHFAIGARCCYKSKTYGYKFTCFNSKTHPAQWQRVGLELVRRLVASIRSTAHRRAQTQVQTATAAQGR